MALFTLTGNVYGGRQYYDVPRIVGGGHDFEPTAEEEENGTHGISALMEDYVDPALYGDDPGAYDRFLWAVLPYLTAVQCLFLAERVGDTVIPPYPDTNPNRSHAEWQRQYGYYIDRTRGEAQLIEALRRQFQRLNRSGSCAAPAYSCCSMMAFV